MSEFVRKDCKILIVRLKQIGDSVTLKNVKKFYIKNKGISRIGIISFIISISYIITYNMPDYFGIEPLYAFLNNVSISYIAALVFFVVQVYIPEENNKEKAMQILNNHFVNLVEFIEVLILLSEKYIEIKDKGASIHWNGDEDSLYFKYTKVGAVNSYRVKSYTKVELLQIKKELHKLLNSIKEKSVIHYCDYDILEKLSEIEKASFFDTLSTLVLLKDSDISFNGFSDSASNLKLLIDEFKKLCSISVSYSIEDADIQSKVIADLLKGDVVSNLASLDNINKKVQKEFLKAEIKKNIPGIEVSDEILEKAVNQISK